MEPELCAQIDGLFDARASHCNVLTHSDKRELKRLRHCIEVTAHERLTEFKEVATVTGKAIMMVHESDAWGCDILQTMTAASSLCRIHRVASRRASRAVSRPGDAEKIF